MAVKIRQEINILDAILSAASGSSATSNEIVQLDTTQYINPTYYFEIVADTSVSLATSVTLRRKGTSTDDATCSIPTLTTAYTRIRSSSFTPPSGQTEYVVFISNTVGATKNVKSARIIIIDNPTTLTSSETQIEIGNNETGKTNTAAAALTNPKYWLYTAANWDGTKTFYAECAYAMSSTKVSGTITLQEDNGSFGGWTDKVTIVSAGMATTATRVRSSSFTPTDGRNYRIAVKVSSSKSAASIYNAKIIVDQVGTTTTGSYYFDASDAAASDPDNAWSSDANLFDSSISTAAVANTDGSVSANYLMAEGTNSPTSGNAITQVRARVRGFDSDDAAGSLTLNGAVYTNGLGTLLGTATLATGAVLNYGSYTTLSVPSGGWTWQTINDLEVKVYRTSSGGAGKQIGAAIVELEVTYYSAGFTLLEPQYLLLNTADGGTGLQTYQTLIDKTNEWSGVTLTGKHAIDSDNASNSAKLQDIDNANADITSSTVTGANQQISGDVWANFTDGHQVDVNVTNSTGTVAASRIIVGVTVSTAATTTSTSSTSSSTSTSVSTSSTSSSISTSSTSSSISTSSTSSSISTSSTSQSTSTSISTSSTSSSTSVSTSSTSSSISTSSTSSSISTSSTSNSTSTSQSTSTSSTSQSTSTSISTSSTSSSISTSSTSSSISTSSTSSSISTSSTSSSTSISTSISTSSTSSSTSTSVSTSSTSSSISTSSTSSSTSISTSQSTSTSSTSQSTSISTSSTSSSISTSSTSSSTSVSTSSTSSSTSISTSISTSSTSSSTSVSTSSTSSSISTSSTSSSTSISTSSTSSSTSVSTSISTSSTSSSTSVSTSSTSSSISTSSTSSSTSISTSSTSSSTSLSTSISTSSTSQSTSTSISTSSTSSSISTSSTSSSISTSSTSSSTSLSTSSTSSSTSTSVSTSSTSSSTSTSISGTTTSTSSTSSSTSTSQSTSTSSTSQSTSVSTSLSTSTSSTSSSISISTSTSSTSSSTSISTSSTSSSTSISVSTSSTSQSTSTSISTSSTSSSTSSSISTSSTSVSESTTTSTSSTSTSISSTSSSTSTSTTLIDHNVTPRAHIPPDVLRFGIRGQMPRGGISRTNDPRIRQIKLRIR